MNEGPVSNGSVDHARNVGLICCLQIEPAEFERIKERFVEDLARILHIQRTDISIVNYSSQKSAT